VLQQYAPQSYYFDWLEHSEPDDYWRQLSPRLEAVDLPMLHIGGWFDSYLTGSLRLYKEISARSQNPQYLVVGPWAHLPWGRKVGALDFGPEAVSPIDRLQVRWFVPQRQRHRDPPRAAGTPVRDGIQPLAQL
jgi:hypothetical protein